MPGLSMTKTEIEELLDHCKHYHAAGWTLKVLTPGEKVLSTATHHDLDGRVRAEPGDLQTIGWWIERLGHPNIGLDLKASGLCVVDIDHRGDYREGFDWLMKQQPADALPRIDYGRTRSITPHGVHVPFRNNLSPDKAVSTQAEYNGIVYCSCCRHKIGDFLANGHVVLPPSIVGDKYHWNGWLGGLPDDLASLPYLPRWVFDLVTMETPGSYDGSDYDDDESYYEDWGDDPGEDDPNRCPGCGGDLYVSGETVCCQNLECGWTLADDEEEEVEEGEAVDGQNEH